jgi:hypothetical protein
MQFPERRKDKSPAGSTDWRKSLALRLDRAAHDVNPILVIFAVGLLVLNLTLYIGMAVAGEPFVWTQPHQTGPRGAPAATAASPERMGYGR